MNNHTAPELPVAMRRYQHIALVLLGAGLVVMFWPVFSLLAKTVWASDEQGHGPIILAVASWLIWMRRERFSQSLIDPQPGAAGAWLLFSFGLALYFVGRLQNIILFQMLSLVPLLASAMAVTFGWSIVKACAFPLFFILFAVPLPGPVVDALTGPLKQAVSWVAEQLLWAAGYPISRSGVILMVGQYQLLVADACAGLNSMFTLEALGLLYMNLIGHTSRTRNILLAILIVPMSFIANIVRVMILVLVTYHFGDEAGQGIVHGAAGMLLFMIGLILMMLMDRVLGVFFRNKSQRVA